MDIQAIFQKQKERFLRHSADRALKSVIKQYSGFLISLQAVAEEDLALVQHALNKGATAHLLPGAIDGLMTAPRLAHYLMQQGAKPSEGFLDKLQEWHKYSAPFFSRITYNKAPNSDEEWLHLVLREAATLAPELDWQRIPQAKYSRHEKEPLANQLDYPFSGFSDHLRKLRWEQGIPQGPLHETTEYYSGLLGELMLENPRAKWIEKEAGMRKQMMSYLLSKGANPNGRVKLNSYNDKTRSLLAHTFLSDYRLVPLLLDAGAEVSRQVIDEVAFILHDRQRPIRVNKEDYRDTLLAVLRKAKEPIAWDEVTTSDEYHRPSLRHVLEKIFPNIENDINLINSDACAQELDQATVEVSTPNRAPSRRL